jgi:hypothetical protein
MRGKNDGASEARWGTSLGLTLPKFVTKMKQFSSPFPFPLLFFSPSPFFRPLFPRRENRWREREIRGGERRDRREKRGEKGEGKEGRDRRFCLWHVHRLCMILIKLRFVAKQRSKNKCC